MIRIRNNLPIILLIWLSIFWFAFWSILKNFPLILIRYYSWSSQMIVVLLLFLFYLRLVLLSQIFKLIFITILWIRLKWVISFYRFVNILNFKKISRLILKFSSILLKILDLDLNWLLIWKIIINRCYLFLLIRVWKVLKFLFIRLILLGFIIISHSWSLTSSIKKLFRAHY